LMVSGDFNGDGISDVVLLDGVHLGVGDGTFRGPLSGMGLQASDAYGPAVAGDFSGDGKLDLAISSNDTVLLLLGNGDGTFQAGMTDAAVAAGLTVRGVLVAGDFNGDGRLDLALDSGSGVLVLLSNGDGTFQPPKVSLRIGTPSGAMVPADFDGDGKLDLAVVDLFGSIDV